MVKAIGHSKNATDSLTWKEISQLFSQKTQSKTLSLSNQHIPSVIPQTSDKHLPGQALGIQRTSTKSKSWTLIEMFSKQGTWEMIWNLGGYEIIKPRSPILQADSLPSEPSGKPMKEQARAMLNLRVWLSTGQSQENNCQQSNLSQSSNFWKLPTCVLQVLGHLTV